MRLHCGEGHSSVSEDVSDSVGGDVCIDVSLDRFVLGLGIGVPSHMAVLIMAVFHCFVQRLSLGLLSSSSMICRLRVCLDAFY